MIRVLVNMARAADVLHQIYARRPERLVNALQHVERLRLVVDRIERRHEVIG